MIPRSDIAAVELRVAQLSGEPSAPLTYPIGASGMAATAAGGTAFSALLANAGASSVAIAARAPCIVPQPQLERIIAGACAANGTDPALVKAIVAYESGFDASATSSVGAAGLMQLMPGTAADLGVGDRYDPRQNVAGGTNYLHQLLKHFGGNVALAAAAYNAGPAAIDHGEIGPETTAYVHAVLASWETYRRPSSSRLR